MVFLERALSIFQLPQGNLLFWHRGLISRFSKTGNRMGLDLYSHISGTLCSAFLTRRRAGSIDHGGQVSPNEKHMALKSELAKGSTLRREFGQ